MNINKEQWAEIEEKLTYDHSYINFQYKDTEINVMRKKVKEGKTELAVYLDGKICVGWGFTDSELFNPLTKLFWKQVSRSLYSQRYIKQMEKIWGKRQAKKEFPKLHEKLTYYRHAFSKASVLVRQFKCIKGLSLKDNNTGEQND